VICYRRLLQTIETEKKSCCVGALAVMWRVSGLGPSRQRTGRTFALIGRSLTNMVSAARVQVIGRRVPIIDAAHLATLPREEVLVVVTGSQGESKRR